MESTTFDRFKASKLKAQGKGNIRMCGDFISFQYHVEYVKKFKNVKRCDVLGIYTYTACVIFEVFLRYLPQHGKKFDQICFICYHSEPNFGLCKSDYKLLGKNRIVHHHQRRWSLIIQVTSITFMELPHNKLCGKTSCSSTQCSSIHKYFHFGDDKFHTTNNIILMQNYYLIYMHSLQ